MMPRTAGLAVVTALSALALGLAGCSTKSNSETTGKTGAGSSSSVPSAAGELGRGVSADAVKIGIVYPDLKAISNLVSIDQGDYRAAFTAVIDDVNRRGGVAGRKLVPVFGPVNPIGTAPAEAACTKLTEDAKVFAVLSVYVPNPQCYLGTHATPLIGNTAVTAQQAKDARAPWFSFHLTPEHSVPKVLGALAKEGVFQNSKVAVTGLAADESTMKQLALPELKSLGVNVVATAVNDAPTTDVSAGYAQYGLIAKKFQSAGATVVVAVGTAGTAWPKALQVNRSSYRPRVVATDWNALAGYVADTSGNDPDVLHNAVSGALSPSNDVSWNDKVLQDCITVIRSANPGISINNPVTATAKTPNTWVAPINACQNIAFLDDLLQAAGKTLNNDTLTRAGESLKHVVLPGDGGAVLHYDASHHDGDSPIFLSHYDQASKILVVDRSPS